MTDTSENTAIEPVDVLKELDRKDITAFPAKLTNISLVGELVQIDFIAYGGEKAAMLISPNQIPEIIKHLFGVGVDAGIIPYSNFRPINVCACCEEAIIEEASESVKH